MGFKKFINSLKNFGDTISSAAENVFDEVPPDRAGRADDKGFLIGNVRHGCQWLCSFKGKHYGRIIKTT